MLYTSPTRRSIYPNAIPHIAPLCYIRLRFLILGLYRLQTNGTAVHTTVAVIYEVCEIAKSKSGGFEHDYEFQIRHFYHLRKGGVYEIAKTNPFEINQRQTPPKAKV